MSEKLARRFHEIYERLAPNFGYETRTETRQFNPTTPNGRLMIAVTDEIEEELTIPADVQETLECALFGHDGEALELDYQKAIDWLKEQKPNDIEEELRREDGYDSHTGWL